MDVLNNVFRPCCCFLLPSPLFFPPFFSFSSSKSDKSYPLVSHPPSCVRQAPQSYSITAAILLSSLTQSQATPPPPPNLGHSNPTLPQLHRPLLDHSNPALPQLHRPPMDSINTNPTPTLDHPLLEELSRLLIKIKRQTSPHPAFSAKASTTPTTPTPAC